MTSEEQDSTIFDIFFLSRCIDDVAFLVSMIPENVAFPYTTKYVQTPWHEYNDDPDSLLQVLYL